MSFFKLLEVGAGGRRAGARGAQAGRRQRAGQAQAGCRRGCACAGRLGVLAGQLGQVGALCTWLSFDSVFDRFDLELFLSHEMNTVHCKIFKFFFIKLNKNQLK